MFTLTLDTAAPTLARTHLALGEGGRGPGGTLAVNNRCLERDGRPWLPVMGECHYSRLPAPEWADALRRMRAGGIDIVASYVFWSHHEATPANFDWTGCRDLRRFVQLAQAAGLMVCLRPGPWVHAEARHGGLPDWLVAEAAAGAAGGPSNEVAQGDAPIGSAAGAADGIALRSNDARYLAHVRRFFGAIGQQLRGLLWSDGGPLVGVQLENEYDGRGPGRGAEHIAALKAIARDEAGLRVPLWTVTGWPTLDIPPGEVLPLSGAYPDGFWGAATGPQPPSGVFAFNTGRTIGEMGNVGGTPPEGRIDPAHYPFFLAEAGGGMHVSYHRRPVVTADDVAACALVQLGSGANLYGYYMYHGGTNPGRGLQETQASGYPNDVAELGYDFRAPLGQYGQVRPSYGRLRRLHSFMAAFGTELALMNASVGPATDPADLAQLRYAARAGGDGGFLFVNNHCRHHPLPAFDGVQFALHAPAERADEAAGHPAAPAAGHPLPQPAWVLPSQPVTVASGAYFIWPFGQRIGAARLHHATLQPLTRWTESGRETWVAFALPGVPAELCFEAGSLRGAETLEALPAGLQATRAGGHLLLQLAPDADLPLQLPLTDAHGVTHRLLLLSSAQADGASRQRLAGRERLLICEHALHVEDDAVIVRSSGPARVMAWPADDLGAGDGIARWDEPDRPGSAFDLTIEWRVTQDRQQPPAPRDGPWVAWRGRRVPLAPANDAYADGLHLELLPPGPPPPAGKRLLLTLDYVGDAARLLADGVLVDDQFADGEPWHIGLDRFVRADGGWPRFSLQIVPADPALPIFLEDAARQRLAAAAPRRAGLLGATLQRWRRVRLHIDTTTGAATWQG